MDEEGINGNIIKFQISRNAAGRDSLMAVITDHSEWVIMKNMEVIGTSSSIESSTIGNK